MMKFRALIFLALAVTTGLCESDPVAPNILSDGSDDPEGRALNRRVEIKIRTQQPAS